MKRWIVLGVLVAVGVLPLIVTANQPQGEMVVEVEQLEDNLYVLKGGGGNSAVFMTSDGVVVVDTKMAGWGRPILDAIRELTPDPVTMIINTHTHFDHASGNVEFSPTVDVVAHENTQRLMREWNLITGFNFAGENVFEASNGRGIATRTFTDTMTLGSGADQIDLYYFGRGHTGGDAWVVFPSLRTLHIGDMFPSKEIPVMDANNGGSGVDFPATLKKGYATLTDIDTIITGHSTQMTRDELWEYAEFMDSLVAFVGEAKQAGRSVEKIASTWEIPARFAGYNAQPTERVAPFLKVIYDELP
jgi:glyoxylase-like metal-dependent hydrolase (beta-lactamase superfamily II)